jgi:hydroxypyruvate reductase
MENFSLTELKSMARAIFSKAIAAVNPFERLKEILRIEKDCLFVRLDRDSENVFKLNTYNRIFLIGTGKASASMAQAIEKIFGDRITKGVITTKYGHLLPLKKTEVIECGHPIPDENGIKGAKKILSVLKKSGPEDLVIFVLSGGGSALLPLPTDGITLEEKQEVTQLLLDCGADIKEINTIRKHISQIKGGWLAKWAYPSTVIGFILSDVVGDQLDVIGSGPTVPDRSTFEGAWEILRKYDLLKEISPTVEKYLLLGKEGNVEETPKPGDVAFKKVYNHLIGSNILALHAAEKEASSLGFHTLILSSSIVGETREAARFHSAIVKEVIFSGNPVPRPACIISGGETTVTIKGNGFGGRNQEFALAGALEISGLEKVVLLSGGTDGTDGPTDASGAVADHTTVHRAESMGLDPKAHLENNNAYPFFQSLGDLLITGPTHTNVMDVRILLVD